MVLERTKKEREREDHLERLGLLIYWAFPFLGLRLLACILALFACILEVVPLLQVSLLHVRDQET